MATQKKPIEQPGPAQEDEAIPIEPKPSTTVAAPDPATTKATEPKLNFGEVLLATINPDGSEGTPFKVSTSTHKAYYQDETKFRVKKTFQA